MKRVVVRLLAVSALISGAVVVGLAQQVPAVPAMNDPRVGLKAGLHDARSRTGRPVLGGAAAPRRAHPAVHRHSIPSRRIASGSRIRISRSAATT